MMPSQGVGERSPHTKIQPLPPYSQRCPGYDSRPRLSLARSLCVLGPQVLAHYLCAYAYMCNTSQGDCALCPSRCSRCRQGPAQALRRVALVDPRGGRRSMAAQILDNGEVDVPIGQAGGESMPEGMRMQTDERKMPLNSSRPFRDPATELP